MSELPACIFKGWLHSFEEAAGGVAVYRPLSYHFPLARGREGFEFKEDGEFVQYKIGPTDARLEIPGRWQPEGPNRVRITFTDERATPYTLRILYCDDEVLKVTR